MVARPAKTRSVAPSKARTQTHVLLSDDEHHEIALALAIDNERRGTALGLGTKLRELGLLWARGQAKRRR